MAPKRILIVDDMRTMRAIIPVYLMGYDYVFDLAEDGESALAKARVHPPDIVISDVNMPVMDGFALCRAVRDDRELASIPVILMSSAWRDASTMERGEQVGATHLIGKPIDPAALVAMVESCLREAA